MVEYRTSTSPSASPVQTCSNPLLAKKFGMGQLAQRYGIADMMDFSQCDNSHVDQSIDEEFHAYTTTTFGSTAFGDGDILTFWDVSLHYLPCSLPDLMPCAIEKIEK